MGRRRGISQLQLEQQKQQFSTARIIREIAQGKRKEQEQEHKEEKEKMSDAAVISGTAQPEVQRRPTPVKLTGKPEEIERFLEKFDVCFLFFFPPSPLIFVILFFFRGIGEWEFYIFLGKAD